MGGQEFVLYKKACPAEKTRGIYERSPMRQDSITVCEETRYKADIANLQANDIVAFSPENAVMAMEVTSYEFGFYIKDGNNDGYSFTKAEDGSYTVRTDTDNILYTDVFTITVPLETDISFLDWSDPENMEAPVRKD